MVMKSVPSPVSRPRPVSEIVSVEPGAMSASILRRVSSGMVIRLSERAIGLPVMIELS